MYGFKGNLKDDMNTFSHLVWQFCIQWEINVDFFLHNILVLFAVKVVCLLLVEVVQHSHVNLFIFK
jgi:hypothetical protein